MEGGGISTSGFAGLYAELMNMDTRKLGRADLYKLAQAIDEADEFYGIRESSLGRAIPDAWHSVNYPNWENHTPDGQ